MKRRRFLAGLIGGFVALFVPRASYASKIQYAEQKLYRNLDELAFQWKDFTFQWVTDSPSIEEIGRICLRRLNPGVVITEGMLQAAVAEVERHASTVETILASGALKIVWWRVEFERKGWTPVHFGDFGGRFDWLSPISKKPSGEINMRGMILMTRPTAIKDGVVIAEIGEGRMASNCDWKSEPEISWGEQKLYYDPEIVDTRIFAQFPGLREIS